MENENKEKNDVAHNYRVSIHAGMLYNSRVEFSEPGYMLSWPSDYSWWTIWPKHVPTVTWAGW